MPPLFQRSPKDSGNQIEALDPWPIQYREYALSENMVLEDTGFPEIFLLLEGSALHEFQSTKQALRPGMIIVAHPGNEHHIKEPDGLRMVGLRFMIEWLSGDLDTALDSPDVLSLIFSRHIFHYPSDTTLWVFGARPTCFDFITADLDAIRYQIERHEAGHPLTRIAFLKLLLHLGEEFGHFWRGQNRIDLRDEIRDAIRAVEAAIGHGNGLRLKDLEPLVGMSLDHFGRVFRKATGMTLIDFAQKRRAHHAARLLSETDGTAISIAARLGYTDSAHFSKSFRRYFNMTPTVYRETFRAQRNGSRGEA